MASEAGGLVVDSIGVLTVGFKYASQGALQALSMTNKYWLTNAYSLDPSAWETIDMSEWPFALKEHRAEVANVERARTGNCLNFSEFQEMFLKNEIAGVDSGDVRGRPDSLASDNDLRNAFKRITKGCVKNLVACSSLLSNDGVADVLTQHGHSLLSLCLGSSGSKQLSGLCLSACPVFSNLRKLEIHDIKGLPLQDLAKCCDLEQLLIRFEKTTVFLDVMAICKFHNLQVLKITTASTSRAGLPWQPFMDLFTSCRQLRVVHLYGSVEMSNGMLLRIMTNLSHLEDFVGSRCEWGAGPQQGGEFPFPGGARVVDMCDLDRNVIETFKQHYPKASRILVDDVFGAGLADGWF